MDHEQRFRGNEVEITWVELPGTGSDSQVSFRIDQQFDPSESP